MSSRLCGWAGRPHVRAQRIGHRETGNYPRVQPPRKPGALHLKPTTGPRTGQTVDLLSSLLQKEAQL